MPNIDQWRNTWKGLGAAAPETLFDQMPACHAESHRKYHTAHHLDECFPPEETDAGIFTHCSESNSGGMLFHGATGALTLSGMSQHLPGFDSEAVTEASAMMSGGVVVREKEKNKNSGSSPKETGIDTERQCDSMG